MGHSGRLGWRSGPGCAGLFPWEPGQQLLLPGEALALHSSGRAELSAFPAQALLALTELSGGAGEVNHLGFVLQELWVTSAFCALSEVH